MGIKDAYIYRLVVLRRLYGHFCSAWRSPWQVSGHFHSGTKESSLPTSLVFYRTQNNSGMPYPGFSPSKQTMLALREAMVCFSRTSLAAEWPISAFNENGRRRLWRQSCNVRVWTSAAWVWHASSWGILESTIRFLRVRLNNLFFDWA